MKTKSMLVCVILLVVFVSACSNNSSGSTNTTATNNGGGEGTSYTVPSDNDSATGTATVGDIPIEIVGIDIEPYENSSNDPSAADCYNAVATVKNVWTAPLTAICIYVSVLDKDGNTLASEQIFDNDGVVDPGKTIKLSSTLGFTDDIEGAVEIRIDKYFCEVSDDNSQLQGNLDGSKYPFAEEGVGTTESTQAETTDSNNAAVGESGNPVKNGYFTLDMASFAKLYGKSIKAKGMTIKKSSGSDTSYSISIDDLEDAPIYIELHFSDSNLNNSVGKDGKYNSISIIIIVLDGSDHYDELHEMIGTVMEHLSATLVDILTPKDNSVADVQQLALAAASDSTGSEGVSLQVEDINYTYIDLSEEGKGIMLRFTATVTE